MEPYSNHPCFNASCCTLYGRLHLPVAPGCNVQCNYCSRKFDCVNESRPGVSSRLMTPKSAENFLKDKKDYINKFISVIGIAGPGDPMATPDVTIETLSKARSLFPDKLLCLSTNGLNLSPYIDDLNDLHVSHVTITINAIKIEICAKIYKWVDYNGTILQGINAAEVLLHRQLLAIEILKKKGFFVKVNTVIIPGINDYHIKDLAREMAHYGVDIHNCIGLIPVPGTAFENMVTPSKDIIDKIRKDASAHIREIYHCNRCRADACGFLE